MIVTIFSILALWLLPFSVLAHMDMSYPPSLRNVLNPYTTDADYSLTSPLAADGSNYPCKGYLSLLGTPQGRAVADWTAGGQYNFSIAGGAYHDGGSCQYSLSYDKGKTFTVIHSYIGSCPTSAGGSFDFVVPEDAPAADAAVAAWSWVNKVGNREFYMDCAVVKISSSSSSSSSATVDNKEKKKTKKRDAGSASVPFAQRPAIFLANLGAVADGCATTESVDTVYPDPGPDVTRDTSTPGPPVGNCGAAATAAASASSSSAVPSSAMSSSSSSSSLAPLPTLGSPSSSSSSSSATAADPSCIMMSSSSSSSSASPSTTAATSAATESINNSSSSSSSSVTIAFSVSNVVAPSGPSYTTSPVGATMATATAAAVTYATVTDVVVETVTLTSVVTAAGTPSMAAAAAAAAVAVDNEHYWRSSGLPAGETTAATTLARVVRRRKGGARESL